MFGDFSPWLVGPVARQSIMVRAHAGEMAHLITARKQKENKSERVPISLFNCIPHYNLKTS
jgi:hypothetical protein